MKNDVIIMGHGLLGTPDLLGLRCYAYAIDRPMPRVHVLSTPCVQLGERHVTRFEDIRHHTAGDDLSRERFAYTVAALENMFRSAEERLKPRSIFRPIELAVLAMDEENRRKKAHAAEQARWESEWWMSSYRRKLPVPSVFPHILSAAELEHIASLSS